MLQIISDGKFRSHLYIGIELVSGYKMKAIKSMGKEIYGVLKYSISARLNFYNLLLLRHKTAIGLIFP